MKNIRVKNQKGMALVVSMIILISLTMLGLTSIQRTTTDLSMAGNQRETGLMFQAAEVGLIKAEGFIENQNSNSVYDSINPGLIEVLSDDDTYTGPDYFDYSVWNSSSQEAATFLQTIEQPKFMIEYLGDRSQNPLAGVNIGSYGSEQTGEVVSIYRATSRGAGLTGNSYRYIQSYFGKEAP